MKELNNNIYWDARHVEYKTVIHTSGFDTLQNENFIAATNLIQ